jgi:choline dehydrogenase-like flavoprotein
MFIDARSLEDGAAVEADLCIVGCGPAAIAIADGLRDTSLRIAIVESGGPERDPEADELGNGYSIGYPYTRVGETHARGIGGSSIHWLLGDGPHDGWNARPLDAADMEARPWIGAPAWPLSRADLEPFFPRTGELAGLGPHVYEVEDWLDAPPRVRDLRIPGLETHLFQQGQRRFSDHIPHLADAPNVTVYHHATALEILTTDDAHRVTGIEATQRPGARLRFSAGRYVLATGGMENARLLLLSRRARPAGLGNDHDLVGRYFMERLSGAVATFVPTATGRDQLADFATRRPIGGSLIRPILTLTPETVRSEGLRRAAFWFWDASRSYSSEGMRGFLTVLRARHLHPRPPGLARYAAMAGRGGTDVAKEIAARALGRSRWQQEVFRVDIQAEQAPNRDSRIRLSTHRDRNGQPLPVVDWQPTADDRASIRRTLDLADDALQAAGLGRFEDKIGDHDPPVILYGLSHHVGTTRMSPDPTAGVVDADSRVHGVENLYVAGSSVYPSAGFANPTYTLVAMALRLAAHLRSTGTSGEVAHDPIVAAAGRE